MKKRVFLMLLCLLTLAAALCLFTACGENGNTDSSENGENNDGDSNEGGSSGNNDSGQSPDTPKVSVGLEYELSVDKTYYTVTGLGTCIDSELVIPSTYEGKPVKKIADSAFKECSSITGVVIPDGVDEVGYWAFNDCEKLTKVSIPDSVIDIGGGAFFNTAIYNNKANWENDVLYIGKHLIAGAETMSGTCNIKEGTICIASEAFMKFGDGMKIDDVIIPDTVISIGGNAFYNTAFSNDETNWENDVLYIGKYLIEVKNTLAGEYTIKEGTSCIAEGAFINCNELTSVIVPKSVNFIGNQVFMECQKLVSINVSEENAVYKSVNGNLYTKDGKTLIRYAIGKTDTSFIIPDTVTTVGESAFAGCENLVSVVVPDSVLFIDYDAFENCIGISNITIGSGVNAIDSYVFYRCLSLNQITVSEENSTYKSVDGNLYTKDGKVLVQYAIGKTDKNFAIPNNVTTIAPYAFACCEYLTGVTIGEGVIEIKSSAFFWCTGLTSIQIPDSVKTIAFGAFYHCTNLGSITLGVGVTSIGEMAFCYCGISSVEIPDGVIAIEEQAFSKCSNLESVIISDSVKSIGEMAFYNCESLTSVTIPGSVETIGFNAFYDCPSLTSINVSEENTVYKSIDGNLYSKDGKTIIQYARGKKDTSFTIPNTVETIGSYAFSGCVGLMIVTIPNSVISIDDGAFSNCTGLTSVAIGNSVKTVGSSAFYCCTGLTSVTIPDSVTTIGSYAFDCCPKLTIINYRGTETQWNAISKGYDWNYNTGNYTVNYNYTGE